MPHRASMDSITHSYDQKKNGTAEQPHESQIAEERSQRMENYPTEGAFYVVTSSASFRLLSLATFSRHLILCATGFVRKPLFETNNNIVFEEIWWPKAKTQTILWWTFPLKISHSRKVCSRKPQNFAWSNCDVFQCIVIETLLWLTLCNSVLPVRQPPIEPALESSRPGLVCEAQTIKSYTIFSIAKHLCDGMYNLRTNKQTTNIIFNVSHLCWWLSQALHHNNVRPIFGREMITLSQQGFEETRLHQHYFKI